jgi:hypothetical protein
VVQRTGERQGNAAVPLYALAREDAGHDATEVFAAVRTADKRSAAYDPLRGFVVEDLYQLVMQWPEGDAGRSDGVPRGKSGAGGSVRAGLSVCLPEGNGAGSLCAAGGGVRVRMPSAGPTAVQVQLPVAHYATVEPDSTLGAAALRLCLYGENFGDNLAASALLVGGEASTSQLTLADPGEPYGPDHYANACVEIANGLSDGRVAVRLYSNGAVSNATVVGTGRGAVGRAGESQ